MNIRYVDLTFLNTVLVVCIMTISSEGELELVGLLGLRRPAERSTGPERGVRHGEELLRSLRLSGKMYSFHGTWN